MNRHFIMVRIAYMARFEGFAMYVRTKLVHVHSEKVKGFPIQSIFRKVDICPAPTEPNQVVKL